MKKLKDFEKLAIDLQPKLPAVAEKSLEWGFKKCFKYRGVMRRADSLGTFSRMGCLECGHSWKQPGTLINTVIPCDCPACGLTLEVDPTPKRVHVDSSYFNVLTTFKGWQVVRLFILKKSCKIGQKAEKQTFEVLQHFINSSGDCVTFQKPVNNMGFAYDSWQWEKPLQFTATKSERQRLRNTITPWHIYNEKRLLSCIKRNGFKGNYYDFSPFEMFTNLLSDSKTETLLKAGQVKLLNYFRNRDISPYWDSIKICLRNGYVVKNVSDWVDYLGFLKYFNKDLKNAFFVCPADLKKAHDKYMDKKQAAEDRKEWEKRRADIVAAEAEYKKAKARFMGLEFSQGLLSVRVFDSVDQFFHEGRKLRHCIYKSEYYKRADSLLFSARFDGVPVETVEVSLKSLSILQARGYRNVASEHNKQIVQLVNSNLQQIAKRLK